MDRAFSGDCRAKCIEIRSRSIGRDLRFVLATLPLAVSTRAMRFLRIVHGGLSYWARWLDDRTCQLWTDAPYLTDARETDRLVPLREENLLPCATPSKIVCVGRNYAAHARELGNEVPKEQQLFLKAPSSLLSHQNPSNGHRKARASNTRAKLP